MLTTVRKTRKSFLVEYGCAAFLIILMAALYSKGVVLGKLSLLVVGVAMVSIGTAELSRLMHKVQLTSSKILIVDGLIRQSKKHIYVGLISDINSKQGVVQRLLNYGNIHVRSASGEGELHIKDVNQPAKLMNQIEDLIEKYKNG